MDERRREFERQAIAGDPVAADRLRHERCRAGEHCACSTPVGTAARISYSLHPSGVEFDGVVSSVDGVLQIIVNASDKSIIEELLSKIADRLGIPRPSLGSATIRACSYCGAKEGDRCVTASGKIASRPHIARTCIPPGYAYVEDYTDCGFFAPFGHQAVLFGTEVM